MVKCSAVGCENRSDENEYNKILTYHRFPRDPARRDQWVVAMNKTNWKPTKSSVLCSEHFLPEDMDETSSESICVKDTATPSVFDHSVSSKRKIIGEKMPRKNVRRAASKEALKQMQLLSATAAAYEDEDPTETYEIESDDDDDEDVVDILEMPPKKKYKLTHRKSSDDRDVIVLRTVDSSEDLLELEVFPDELSAAQLSAKTKLDNELQELNSRIDSLCQQPNVEILYQGETCSAIEIDGSVLPVPGDPKKKIAAKAAQPKNVVLQPSNTPNSYQLVMDPRLGLIVGTMTPAVSNANPPPLTPVISTNTTTATPPPRQTRRRGRNSVVQMPTPPPPALQQKPGPLSKANTSLSKKGSSTVQLRTGESTAVGGISAIAPAPSRKANNAAASNIVDLTSDDRRPLADSREISFNKLQGKTFPSLVVVARPHLAVKDITGGDRTKLDAKVKSVLMYVPTKFTEWLIQQGLIKSEQNCAYHPTTKLKLGMYSDITKFPFSGGYVWISECCPHRFVSVYSGSLFDQSPHPPSVILKLIYHWSCQTNVQNVVQWVKVDNSYVKLVNAWLRAICTVGLHTHVTRLGGPGVKIEVGVISLGTTSQDGKERKVKVEVLGLLEPKMKRIRLRAVEPIADGDCDYKKRFAKILEPLVHCVHPESTIITDLTVDKSTLINMGFLNVQQSPATEQNPSNQVIMEYLRRIVPRMFQNTLSLLSRQIIQQFLDELVWREWFGATTAECFDNILLHLSEQTRSETSQHPNLTSRLAKVSANPFKNWSINVSSQPSTTVGKTDVTNIPSKRSSTRRKIMNVRMSSPVPEASQLPPQQPAQRPPRTISPDVPEQMVPLENYYYGTIEGDNDIENGKISWNMKCSMCKLTFSNNIKLMTHLFSHAHSITSDTHQCRYCLSSVRSEDGLNKHISSSHPHETRIQDEFSCIICEVRFKNSFLLGRHLSKEHVPSELPYKCGTCGHRCSSHRQAIDHFYKDHDNAASIQCPFCLKSTALLSGGRIMSQNLNFFMQHLQKHQKKAMAKKCAKCALWFIHKDSLKEHQINMHTSQRRKAGLLPWTAPRNSLMVPKSKQDKQVWEDADREFSFSNLVINASNKMICKECKTSVGTPKHYQALESCTNRNCQYLTCCKKAMDSHAGICENLNNSLPIHDMKTEMHCICGYRIDDGNLLAKHLAECERKSAYPTAEAAKGAIKTHSMLDVLGLVRRPEEPTPLKSAKRPKLETDSLKPKPRPKPKPSEEVIDLDDDDDDDVQIVKQSKIEEESGFKISQVGSISDDEDEKTENKKEENNETTVEKSKVVDDDVAMETEDKLAVERDDDQSNSGDDKASTDVVDDKSTTEEFDGDTNAEKSEESTPMDCDDKETLIDPQESSPENDETEEVSKKQTKKVVEKETEEVEEEKGDKVEEKETEDVEEEKSDQVKDKETEVVVEDEAEKVVEDEAEKVVEKDAEKLEEKETEKINEKDSEDVNEKQIDEKDTAEVNEKESEDDNFANLVENIENIEKYLESTEIHSNNKTIASVNNATIEDLKHAFDDKIEEPKNDEAMDVDSPKLFDDLSDDINKCGEALVDKNSEETSNNLNFDAIAELMETDK